MNFLKRLPIVTIIVAVIAALYFKEDIKSALDKHWPAGAKMLKLTASETTK